MHAVAAYVDGSSEHCVAGDHDVERDGVIDWNPLAGGAHATHGGLKALEGRQDQHGKVQVHAVAASLSDRVGPGLVEAPAQV